MLRPARAAARELAWLARPAGEGTCTDSPENEAASLSRRSWASSWSSSARRLISPSSPPSDEVSEPEMSGKGSPGRERIKAGGSGEPDLLDE